MYPVEVDDEVFSFVQKHAEPLIDSFNSTLRRILGLSDKAVAQTALSTKARSINPDASYQIPAGTPQALIQILEVVRLVRKGGYTRSRATRLVAAGLGVAPQTVLDKYTRQLGLTASKFDRLLEPERLDELRRALRSKFPEHVDVVDQRLGLGISQKGVAPSESLPDIAARIFGLEHGAELEIPHRGAAPRRPPPDFSQPQSER